MVARALLACAALLIAPAQPQSTWVDVIPEDSDLDDVEKRFTPELTDQLESARDDALLLYTEFSARSGAEMKIFLKSLTNLTRETVAELPPGVLNVSEPCRSEFEKRLKKIEYDAHRAASFSAENHHKFYLGHMIVFRMHLNKSEDYIRRCEKIIRGCGIPCETTPKMVRWRRLALDEIHRVRQDMHYSRRSYRDLLAHEHRKLNALRRQMRRKTRDAIDNLQACASGG